MDVFRGRLVLAAGLTLLLSQPARSQIQMMQPQMDMSSPWSSYGQAAMPSGMETPASLQPEVRQFPGGTAAVRAVAFFPSAKILASAGFDNTIHIWGLASGKELRSLEGHTGPVLSLVIPPDGKTLISGSMDHTIRQWDLATGRELRRFEGHQRDVHQLALSADGKFLASASYDSTVRLWGVASGKELRRFEGHRGEVYAVAFSPDGKRLASGGQDHTVRLWDADTGKQRRVLRGHQDVIVTVAFSPDGKRLASGSHDSSARLWDLATGKQRRRLTLPQRQVYVQPNMAWRFNGPALNAAMMPGMGGPMMGGGPTLQSTWCRGVVFSPDGKTLASVGSDNLVRLWEVATGKERGQFYGHNGTVWTITYSPDGRTLATGGDDRTVRLWDATGLLLGNGQLAEAFSPKEMELLWQDLGGEDAGRAYRAIGMLTRCARQTVPFLRQRLLKKSRVSLADPQHLARLLADLDDDQYDVRQRAMDELEQMGKLAEPALRHALRQPHSAEVGFRIKMLLSQLRGTFWSPDNLRRIRSVEVLEHIATANAQALLKALAEESSETGLEQDAKAALGRLAKRAARTS